MDQLLAIVCRKSYDFIVDYPTGSERRQVILADVKGCTYEVRKISAVVQNKKHADLMAKACDSLRLVKMNLCPSFLVTILQDSHARFE